MGCYEKFFWVLEIVVWCEMGLEMFHVPRNLLNALTYVEPFSTPRIGTYSTLHINVYFINTKSNYSIDWYSLKLITCYFVTTSQ